jgi:ferredoxin
MAVNVTLITNGGRVISGPENTNLLRLSIREKGGIPFKCGGGLCGTCKCLIEKGLENTDAIKDKERKHLSEADFAAGHRMACQTFVNGDIAVSWIPLDRRGPKPPAPGSTSSGDEHPAA